MTFADKVEQYLSHLNFSVKLPVGISSIDPYKSVEVQRCIKEFYNKYFSDSGKRTYIFGINPGRFGAGVTGIGFTDPVALRIHCGIENSLGNKRELSSEFIYTIIEKYGGCENFFSQFFITALSPYGFLKDDKNYNYYDSPFLKKAVEPFIIASVTEQITFGANKNVAICLGKKNASYFSEINATHHFFKKIIMLEHPRFILQYHRKDILVYTKKYIDALKKAAEV